MREPVPPRKKLLAVLAGVALVALVAGLSASRPLDPRDFHSWSQLAVKKDWPAAALEGEPEAQFLMGMRLIRTNLAKMVSRVPYLSRVPVVGRRYFEETSYQIDNDIDPGQLQAAYGWIAKSAAQNFTPAQEAQKLFAGRLSSPGGVDDAGAAAKPSADDSPAATK